MVYLWMFQNTLWKYACMNKNENATLQIIWTQCWIALNCSVVERESRGDFWPSMMTWHCDHGGCNSILLLTSKLLEIPRGPRGMDSAFLDPRGMVNCYSSIPRFLEEWNSPRNCHSYSVVCWSNITLLRICMRVYKSKRMMRGIRSILISAGRLEETLNRVGLTLFPMGFTMKKVNLIQIVYLEFRMTLLVFRTFLLIKYSL